MLKDDGSKGHDLSVGGHKRIIMTFIKVTVRKFRVCRMYTFLRSESLHIECFFYTKKAGNTHVGTKHEFSLIEIFVNFLNSMGAMLITHTGLLIRWI